MAEPMGSLESAILAQCDALQGKLDALCVSGRDTPGILALARPLAEAGLLGLTIPRAQGGQGQGVLAATIALEEVGRRWPQAVDSLYFGNFSITRVLGEAGSRALRERVLQPLLQGRAVLPMAITEPEAGSAAADLAARANPRNGGFAIQGTKRFVSLADDARHIAVAVRFGAGVETIGAVVVSACALGIALGPRRRFMSGESWREVRFSDVAVDAEDVILHGGLFTRWGALFDCDKLGTAARALGMAMHCFDTARAYVLARKQFGRPLCEFQSVQAQFGVMDAQLTGARLALRSAAAACDRGSPIGRDAAVAKLLCCEAAQTVCGAAVPLMGGTGYSDLASVEYCLRKSVGLAITAGTTELLKVKVAESVFGRRFPQAAPNS